MLRYIGFGPQYIGSKEVSSTVANENEMYVERRSDRRYNVSWGNSKRPSAVTDTQKEGIDRARELNPGHQPHVERVRETDKGSRDKWRKP